MKIINIILSLYLVVLSCLPCADMKLNSLADSSIKVTSNHENHSHNKENDLCPPFCVCACCGIHIYQSSIQTIYFKENLIFINQKEQISFYSYIYNKKITLNIWQPPKIS